MCEEVEELNKVHRQLLYTKIKEFQHKSKGVIQMLKDKQGMSMMENEKILEWWPEYVKELYDDKDRGADIGNLVHEVYIISSEEVKTVIRKLPKDTTSCNDNITAEQFQDMGEKELEIVKK